MRKTETASGHLSGTPLSAGKRAPPPEASSGVNIGDVLLIRIWHIGTPTHYSKGEKMPGSPNCPIQQAQPASLRSCPADFQFVNSSSCYTSLATAHTLLSVMRSHCSLLCLTSYNQQGHPGTKLLPMPTTPQTRVLILSSLSLHFVPPLKQSGILCIRKRHRG